jgi:UDP-glucuronate decarboxylase
MFVQRRSETAVLRFQLLHAKARGRISAIHERLNQICLMATSSHNRQRPASSNDCRLDVIGSVGVETVVTRDQMIHNSECRILVTGGAGFLGSHLCEKLLNLGHEVLCVDNFFTGSRRNIEYLLDNKRFELMRHDVTFPLYVEVDEIYNLACPASPIHYQFDPVQTTKTSVLGAINMLGLAKRLKVKIFQASTSEVYGDPAVHPQKENYWGNVNPVGIRSCYDEGKRCAETLFFDYTRQHNLPVKVVRIFNTYGPRMHRNDGRVVSNFIVQALKGQNITVYGDGTQSRSFCYVDDLVDATIKMMATARAVTGPINIGNPNEFSIRELAELVIELTGSKSRLMTAPLPSDDPRQRQPDITKAKELLGWAPRIPLREGLVKTIAYFDALLSEDDQVCDHALAS